MRRILIIDDEINILNSMKRILTQIGNYDICTTSDTQNVMNIVQKHSFDLILLDLYMPIIDGRTILRKMKSIYPDIPIIMITGDTDINTAAACMREGASDYITKPVDMHRLQKSIEKVFHISSFEKELNSVTKFLLQDFVQYPEHFNHIITEDKRMLTSFKYIEAIAPTLNPILIIGETGTGKEMFAEAIHKASNVNGKLVPVDVSGLDDNMFSDTLFGHKKGAFTGADKDRSGLIEKAAGGTLFLDEIGALQESSQIKLLRLLQTSQYYTLGSDSPRECKARIIAAVNKPIKTLLESSFREDLYYRLSSHQINIPPLRERKDDIEILVRHFYHQAILQYKLEAENINSQSIRLLQSCSFKGNVRELKALIDDMGLRQLIDIPFNQAVHERFSHKAKPATQHHTLTDLFGFFPTLKQLNNQLMIEAMAETNDNQGEAAKLMGLSRQAFNRRWNIMLKAKYISNKES